MSTSRVVNRFPKSIILAITFVVITSLTLIWFGGTKGFGAPSTVTTIQNASNTPSGVTFTKPFTTVPQVTPTRVPVPVVAVSATTCSPNLVSAEVSGVGPNGN